MSYNTFPVLQGLGWPIKVTPTFKTIVQQAASGAEYRTGLWQAPLHLIEVPINFMTQADWATLLAFFIQQQGSLIPFNFTPTQTPWAANAIPFGAWNGSATSAQLVDSRGNPISSASVSSIYRNDWQGNQLLYPTPRTNYAAITNNLAGSGWLTVGVSSVVASGTAPDGSSAFLVTQSTTLNNHKVGRLYTIALSAGDYLVLSFWVKNGTATQYIAQITFGGHYLFVFFATPTSSPTWESDDLAFFASLSAELLPYPAGWYRLSMIVQPAASGNLTDFWMCVNDIYDTGTGLTSYFSDPQLELNSQSTAYIANAGTAPLTITDYTLTGTTVNLAQAPAATAVTRWNGTGSNSATYLVRFPDGVDFEQFMSQLYRTKTLKLQEVR